MRDQDWDIKARSEACNACARPFADQERLFSKLTHTQEGYVRADFCEPCWAGADKAGALSVWNGAFRLPPPPAEEPLKKETAESLLRRLAETEDLANRNTIFILAVMLERRRILVERDVQRREDGVKVRMYEHRHTGEVFVVPDPELHLSELEHVQREVVAMLSGGQKTEVRDQKSEVSGQTSEVSEEKAKSGTEGTPPSDL